MANETTHSTMLEMIRGFQISQMIYTAVKLGIADLLVDGAKTSDEIAAATGSHAPSLYRLMRALASLGIFAADDAGRFGMTPLAQHLRKDTPDSLRAAALYLVDPIFQRVWGELPHSIATGETGFKHLFGMGSWDYREQHPDANAAFNDFMTDITRPDAAAIAAAYDFSGIKTLADVGGGQGSLIASILKANPALRGIVFDLPHVLSSTQAVLEAAGVADRCEIVGGDFFAGLPSADAYILKSIIHDWNDADSIRILESCRRSLAPTGKVLLVEYVIPPGNDPHPGKLSDINMLVSPGGQERTEAEYRDLMAQAGLRLARVIPTSVGRSVIEGVAAVDG